MKYLKEDGSIDAERIDNLPIDEFIEAVESMNQKQYDEYLAKAAKMPRDCRTRVLWALFPEGDERNGDDHVYDELRKELAEHGLILEVRYPERPFSF